MAKDPLTSEINELKTKLSENPDSLLFAPLAEAYRKQGNLEEALATCRKGLEKHPNHTSARVVLGRVYQQQGKIDAAAAEFKKAIEIDAENMTAHTLLGALYLDRDDHQAAIEEFQKVLVLNPDDEEAQKGLKKAIEKAAGERKQPKPSAPESAPAPKKNPAKDSTATLTMAELYLRQGHFEEALEVLRELQAMDPHNMMLRKKIADVEERKKKASEQETKAVPAKPPAPKASPSAPAGGEKTPDDSKFTSEEILQVMRRGGKDDAVVEEPRAAHPPAPKTSPSGASATPKKGGQVLEAERLEEVKGLVAEVGAVNGILRCFLVGEDGIIVVSMGESSNNAGLGQQALAIQQSTNRSVSQLKQGKLQQILVTADNGHLLLLSLAGFVLVVLASAKINLGLLRLTLDAAAKKLEKALSPA